LPVKIVGPDKNMGPLDHEHILTMFALKDIMPGQEIVCSYGDFVASTPKWFRETKAANYGKYIPS
jgi:SET domain-containing protein